MKLKRVPHRRMRQTRTLFTLRLSLVLGLIAFHSSQMRADVAITSPTGGKNVSADKALNSTNGAAFTALGSIVITEGASTDFAVGNNQTLTLTVADGWQFNPGVGTIYAPQADFNLKGSGKTSVDDFTGASITKTTTMAGNFNFHYDESLIGLTTLAATTRYPGRRSRRLPGAIHTPRK